MIFKNIDDALKTPLEVTFLSLERKDLTPLPKTLAPFQNLEQLSIQGMDKEIHWLDFSTLPQLKKLSITYSSLTELPDSLKACQQLQELNLSINNLEELPQVIRSLKALKKLSIGNNKIKELPKWIGELSQLEQLLLNSNQLTKLPDVFDKMPNLTKVSFSHNQLEELPDSLAKESIDGSIVLNPFKKRFPSAALYWNTKYVIDFGATPILERLGMDKRKAQAFWDVLREHNLSGKQRLSAYYIMVDMDEYKDQLALEDLFLMLHLKWGKFGQMYINAQKILVDLHEEYRKQNPIKKGEAITVLGTTAIKRKELKERAIAFGLEFHSKIKKNTKHLVIGKGFKKYKGFDQEGLVFWSDVNIHKALEVREEHFLLEDTEDNQVSKQNLSELLLSQDSDTVQLGLDLLKTAGTPSEVITDLFLIIKNGNLNADIRKKAQNALDLYNDVAIKEKMEKYKYPLVRKDIDERTLQENIDIYTKDTSLDKSKIGPYLFATQGIGLRHWFAQIDKIERKKIVEDLLRQQPDILLNGAWFTDIEEVFQFTQAKRLSLNQSKFRNFPEQVLAFEQLEYLSLEKNTVKTLPNQLKKLSKLQELNLDRNKLKEYPKVIEEMPNLKKIRVYDNPFTKQKDRGINTDLYIVRYNSSELIRK
ncbi:MAG: leucine-rich repeat domain-containing protein [Saprospiraceae bacterium]|nr:leucine-rich repeat domain-containing protein [Saprospiraceae bacterium]